MSTKGTFCFVNVTLFAVALIASTCFQLGIVNMAIGSVDLFVMIFEAGRCIRGSGKQ